MKKTINIVSYILSIVLIVASITIAIYFTVLKNNRLSEIPTLSEAIEEYDLPIIEMNGSMKGISKDDEVELSVKYHSDELKFNSKATLKWQGASSLFYEKKNYTIKFVDDKGEKNKIKIKDEWGKQSKYCLKANYIDHTSSRNVVSAKLFGQIVHSRNKLDKVNELVNGGAIDGFPVVIYLNGDFHGLYTMNIPKDKWLLDMDDTGKQAILMADNWSSSTSMNTTMNTKDVEKSAWEIEYCSTEDTAEGTDWVAESFNKVIDFVSKNNGQDFKDGISQYVDIDRAMDLMLYTLMINGKDNLSKNILWITYDGETWIPSAYDLDSTWGIFCDGNVLDEDQWMTLKDFKSHKNTNLIFKRILENYTTEVKARYEELRQTVMSTDNIIKEFASFISLIPTEIYKYETYLYKDIPCQKTSNLAQISYFARENLSRLDKEFDVL